MPKRKDKDIQVRTTINGNPFITNLGEIKERVFIKRELRAQGLKSPKDFRIDEPTTKLRKKLLRF